MQPHEAHRSYVLHFMIDFNLQRISFMQLSANQHRVDKNILNRTQIKQSELYRNPGITFGGRRTKTKQKCHLTNIIVFIAENTNLQQYIFVFFAKPSI